MKSKEHIERESNHFDIINEPENRKNKRGQTKSDSQWNHDQQEKHEQQEEDFPRQHNRSIRFDQTHLHDFPFEIPKDFFLE